MQGTTIIILKILSDTEMWLIMFLWKNLPKIVDNIKVTHNVALV